MHPRQDDWDMKLPAAKFPYNQGKQMSTRHNPFYLNHEEEAVVLAVLVGRKKIEAEVWGVEDILTNPQDELE